MILTIDAPVESSRRQHDRMFVRTNHLVYSLCCFISGSCNLRKLDVTLHHEQWKDWELDAEEYAVGLWPFAKLDKDVKISFHGISEETDICVGEHLRDTVASPFDTLSLAQEVAGLVLWNWTTIPCFRLAEHAKSSLSLFS